MSFTRKPKHKKAPWVLAGLGTSGKTQRQIEKEEQEDAYRLRARQVVKEANERGEPCPVMLEVLQKKVDISEVHHMRGRLGPLLLDERGWLLVSRLGHIWIEANKDLAREYGFLCRRGEWNVPFD